MIENKLKKCFGLVLVLALLVMASPMVVLATTATTEVSIPSASANPGDTVTIPINITDVTNLGAATIWLNYDSSVVEVTAVGPGDLAGVGYTPLAVANAAGELRMTFMHILAPPGPGGDLVFVNVSLKAVGIMGQTSVLDLDVKTLVSAGFVAIVHTTVDGGFTVGVPDTTKPTVTGVPTGSSEPIGTVVTATFSEAMNTGSAEGAFSMSPAVAGSFSWAGNVMTFTPTSNLDYSTKYTVTITTAAQDLSANTLVSAKSWSFTTEPGPHLVVAKTVNPGTIGRKGSGLAPEESTVTLTVTGAGPAGSLTSVVVTDVLPDYINDEGNFSIAPTSNILNADDTTTLTWNVGTIVVGTTWTVTFDISSDDCGRVLANEYSTSNVVYLDTAPVAVAVTKVFPRTYLIVRCPEEGVTCVIPPGGPAEMSIQNISVNGEEFVQTQEIEVTVSVGNSGGTEGAKTVSLYINGVFEDSQSVTVGPGSGQNVLFRVVGRVVPGTYTVSVEGREAQFTVLGMGPPQSAPAPPMAVAGLGGGLGTAGIIAIIVVIVALGIGLVVILRREST